MFLELCQLSVREWGVREQRTPVSAFMPVNDEHIIIPTGITLLLLDIFRASATESLDVCGGRPETNTLLSLFFCAPMR